MRGLMIILCCLLWSLHAAASAPAQVRMLSSDFVLPGKHARLASWAQQQGVGFTSLHSGAEKAPDAQWLTAVDLLILDTPRPSDVAAVQQRLGDVLERLPVPWIRIGGGAPAYGNLPPPVAMRLIGYYGNGGEANLRQLFTLVQRKKAGQPFDDLPAPVPLPNTGFYHPAAPGPFATLAEYLAWGQGRWAADAPRVAFAIHRGAIADAQVRAIDDLIARSERRGQVPLVFWFDDANPHALTELFAEADIRALVNMQHMQNGPARQKEFLQLGVPVLQTFGHRGGDEQHWQAEPSGMAARSAAAFLSVPEGWGMSDPLVITALEEGEPALMARQAEALLGKLDRLIRLRQLPVAQKRLALMFWNHPDGERNVAASHLNVPASLATLSAALGREGYDVPATTEQQLIDSAQRLLAGYYRPETLGDLLRDGLAETLPLKDYQAWLAHLPQVTRDALGARWGDPAQHWALREVEGEPQFVIPALHLGKLLLLPQPPRAGRPGESYHDSKVPPDHLYLAAYQLVRERVGVDALIHFGTHGTQEWLPGKDRGLSAEDYPFLAVGDLPVFYPYIQDNVGEAIQAKRRGRAVTISHQTPAFAPAGLYDELRDLHHLIHEYQQLDEGAVREKTAEQIRAAVLEMDMQADLGWDEASMFADFPAFFAALHDHLHELARGATPLGLHTFGKPASAEHRLLTVMQQLGTPYYQALGLDSDEVFAADYSELQASLPYQTLQRYLRDGQSLDEVESAVLRQLIAKGLELDSHLADTQELEALLAGLSGRFVAPGAGGDPIRNPEVPSGRNLYAFEADKVPTRAAYAAGGEALQQLITQYEAEHQGQAPQKLAFSLWSSEALRHLGVVESQVLHAMGLRPMWDDGGRVVALDIIPAAELGRPRIDAVLQVTSVYRDQFDGFMRLLADAADRLAALDEPGNVIAANSQALAMRLQQEQGMPADQARQLSSLRVFGNEPGDYGTGVSQLALDSTTWEDDAALGKQFLERLQYGYGAQSWGVKLEAGNLFAEQLKGVQAAVMSRSSELNGLLSTDHPFEFLGGLSAAVRHLDGTSPSLYISDLRKTAPRTTVAAQFLATELRGRYLNPQWIGEMEKEGYAGTLEMLDLVNNLWGWQATDRSMVRDDQWQAIHDTYVMDKRELGLDAWFEQHNPKAQAQLIERLIEAIRKGYWDASEQTRRELVERRQQLAATEAGVVGEALTRQFLEQMAAGFGMHNEAQTSPTQSTGAATQVVTGRVLEEVMPATGETQPQWLLWLGFASMLGFFLAGAIRQGLTNSRMTELTP
ncbi:cobaltochelatase subunit CobN [Ectopseudomonas toyotomiensis]|uniref:Cobaltochelatase subunit CobN n=1 Tax=Ectopseudomonas toyotomiensis TaxID=554344 RepID=A0ABD7DW69_9GAMM|nr:cobaltochelatase subunit CobN [Pseudomonas toyotomiensis]QSL92739.1 cobaltochelatase subunit CobN [Pseudomonas toyotomiensis]